MMTTDDDTDATDAAIDRLMTSHGYEPRSTGHRAWTWSRQADDDSVLWICTYEDALYGDPDEADWCASRRSQTGEMIAQCDRLVTLADALELAPRLQSAASK